MRHLVRYTPRRRAFTLAEAAVSIMIVSVMLVAALNVVATSARARQINARLGVAPALAHDLMSEILQARYSDPDVAAVPVEGPEVLLASHPLAANTGFITVKDKVWVGQCFQPTLPAEAVSWAVTRVKFRAMAVGAAGGVASVALQTPDVDNLPSPAILEAYSMAESSLSGTYTWQEFTFGTVSGLVPGSGLCLTITREVNNAQICNIEFEDVNGAGTGMAVTYEAGINWQWLGTHALFHYVYGKITTLSAPPTTIGRDASESGGDRADLDDVDDYHGWSASPPETKDGTQLSDYTGWTRSVKVEYVWSKAPDGPADVSDQGVKRITVIVTDPRGAQTMLVGLRSNVGVYEQEPAVTKTYVSWVGLDLQIGGANAALSLGTALANEPLAN